MKARVHVLPERGYEAIQMIPRGLILLNTIIGLSGRNL
jgi:hypothetical protein